MSQAQCQELDLHHFKHSITTCGDNCHGENGTQKGEVTFWLIMAGDDYCQHLNLGQVEVPALKYVDVLLRNNSSFVLQIFRVCEYQTIIE